ncbi:MAG TPA: hypothetical protein VFH00_10195 [Candidatus Nitrosotalea sp.]|nr:hypothetical protein [Candidatus Nitrosotalea sp.]
MQAQQVLTRGSRKSLGVALVALVVAIGAMLAIAFAATTGTPSAPKATGATTQPAGGYNDLQPDRTKTHGQLP